MPSLTLEELKEDADAAWEAAGKAMEDAERQAILQAIGKAMGDSECRFMGGVMSDSERQAVGKAIVEAMDDVEREAMGEAMVNAAKLLTKETRAWHDNYPNFYQNSLNRRRP